MAAGEHPQIPRRPRPSRRILSRAELAERLEDEVTRAERLDSRLSCLVVSVDDIDRLAAAHGSQLPEQAVTYLGDALERQLRRYDRVGRPARGELAVVLPGADQRRGEIVARRALGRIHAVKIELDGVRRPLRVSVGIAAWEQGLSGEQLLAQARLAAGAGDIGANLEEGAGDIGVGLPASRS